MMFQLWMVEMASLLQLQLDLIKDYNSITYSSNIILSSNLKKIKRNLLEPFKKRIKMSNKGFKYKNPLILRDFMKKLNSINNSYYNNSILMITKIQMHLR